MIVCLPFHKGDIELARLNLKLLAKWPQQPFSCVLCVDDETDSQEIASLASPVFAEVRTLVYPHYTGPNLQWPRPQNWAWQQTARRMESQKSPWLWWEQDAVPLKPDWLKSLAQAYDDGNQPFMGAWVDYLGNQYMAGVGVYPPRVNAYCPHVLIVESAAFDVFLGKHIASQCHRINELIDHDPDARNGLIESGFSANGAVLFHKCKDGSIQRKILNSTGPIGKLTAFVKRSMIQVKQSKITVVITNFQRPTWVKEAFSSCLKSGVKHIIVSASGTNSELKKAHDWMRKSGAVVDAIDGDLGCNEMWLRGVRLVKTPWVHILHDDDALEPDFMKVEPKLEGAGFAMWQSVQRDQNGKQINVLSNLGGQREGLVHSTSLLPMLMHRGNLAITPVTGLFRSEDVLRTLTECATLSPEIFNSRPGMMIGNDLLIWLRATERHEKFLWIPQILTRLGYWTGSTTCADKVNGKSLPVFYDRMRDYFIEHPIGPGSIPKEPIPEFPTSRIIHCLEVHIGSKEEEKRKRVAYESWESLYATGSVIPARYEKYSRDGTCVGEPRKLPFLKDVIAFGLAKAQPQDLILLTNDDTILHPSIEKVLRNVMASHGATMAHRCEYQGASGKILKSDALFVPGTQHWGRDLFCFTVPWLREHWKEIPDFLLGAPFWDLLLALLIRKTLEKDVLFKTDHIGHSWDWEIPLGYVAHIEHEHIWNNLRPADRYNERLSYFLSQKLHPDKSWDSIIRM